MDCSAGVVHAVGNVNFLDDRSDRRIANQKILFSISLVLSHLTKWVKTTLGIHDAKILLQKLECRIRKALRVKKVAL